MSSCVIRGHSAGLPRPAVETKGAKVMSTSTLRHCLSGIIGIGALLLSVQAASSFGPTEVYRATEAIDYVLGSTHAIGYFQTVEGQCELTLMIAEAVDPDRAAPGSAARLRFALQPGQVAAMACEEGPRIVLVCGARAATLEVKRDEARP
jgi:hypothetical protein